MKKDNLIIFGITILFLVMSIQPVLAINNNSTEDEDDCDICPKVSNQHLVRLKSVVDILEKQDDRIKTLKEMNVKSNSDEYPRICGFLEILGGISIQTFFLMAQIGNLIRVLGGEIVYKISSILALPILVLLWIPLILYFGVFDCYDIYPYINED